MFPWQRYIPAWTHDVSSHSSVAKQQQYILFMVLYIAYSDAGQFIACMCQISLVYVSGILIEPGLFGDFIESTAPYLGQMHASVLKVNNIDFEPRFRSCPAEHYNMLHSSPIFNHICCIVSGSFGCCPFQGRGSVVVDLLFIVLPIVCGSSLFVFVCYAVL